MRKRKKKDGGLSITTISKMLENVKSPQTYTQLHSSSTPILRMGFLKYLKWCVKHDLIIRRMLSRREYYETQAHSKDFWRMRSSEAFRPLYIES